MIPVLSNYLQINFVGKIQIIIYGSKSFKNPVLLNYLQIHVVGKMLVSFLA